MAFPYAQSPDKLVEFIKKIPTVGIPAKANYDFLKSLGFSSSNDRTFVPILKFIAFTDGSATPTDLWKEARTNLGRAMAKGLQAGYGSLFHTYPNAHQQSNEALKNFFKAHSSVGDAAVAKMLSTFKALAAIADFGESGDEASTVVAPGSPPAAAAIPTIAATPQTGSSGGLTLNLNIELQVPSDPTGEVYEKFFAAMKKHLMDNK
jgi:hypothetical protein